MQFTRRYQRLLIQPSPVKLTGIPVKYLINKINLSRLYWLDNNSFLIFHLCVSVSCVSCCISYDLACRCHRFNWIFSYSVTSTRELGFFWRCLFWLSDYFEWKLDEKPNGAATKSSVRHANVKKRTNVCSLVHFTLMNRVDNIADEKTTPAAQLVRSS